MIPPLVKGGGDQRSTPETTGWPLSGKVIRSRGDNEVSVLAGHMQSHGGSWNKFVERPFPLPTSLSVLSTLFL